VSNTTQATQATHAADPLVFNPFDATWRADPYPFYRRLREEAPVGQVPGIGIWYFARYADCEAVLRDPRWSNDDRKGNLYEQFVASGAPPVPDEIVRRRPFIFLDAPDHTRLRKLVSAAFTPRVIEQLRPRIQQLVDECLDTAVEKGRLEIVADLAYPLPVVLISELLGVPSEDHSMFRSWSKELAASLEPELTVPPDVLARRVGVLHEFGEYFLQLMAVRRKQPADDLLSALVTVEDSGDVLSEDELLATLTLLLVAGHETTVNLIGNGVLALLRHPDQLARLRAHPELIRATVEEVLRWDPPVQLDGRTALEDIEVGGVTVGKGEQAMLLLAAANRDEQHLADGEEFDIGRPDLRHLSFAFGPHFCLGAPLARAEAQVALATVVRRFPDLGLAGDRRGQGLRYRDALVLRGLEALPVDFEVRKPQS
jgi:cytochrome P450